MFEIQPEVIDAVRKDVNLDSDERIDEAITLLQEWIAKQEHFTKKDFSRDYLERTLILSKGLVERAKQKMDHLFTYRTLMPEFFVSINKEKFLSLFKFACHAHLPKLTSEYYRVYLIKVTDDNFDFKDLMIYFGYIITVFEYFKLYDYQSGLYLILDLSEANIMNLLTKIPPTIMRQFITIATEGYGLRIKSINLISNSKVVDALVGFFKQVLSAKLRSRLSLHKSIDCLYEQVPQEIFPKEYGGKEKTLKELNEQWIEELTSPDFIKYHDEMNKARTDEKSRGTDCFNDNYIGTPGSFRMLSVD